MLDTAIAQALLNDIVGLGYLGILLAGVLFVSFFTVVPAIVLLLAFTESHGLLAVALLGGLGAMLGDLMILRFAEDKIALELKPVAKRLKLISFIRLLHRKRYKPITATIGSIIIASPLPDEAGIALLGLSRIPTYQLMIVTLILNCMGILFLLLALS